jgi:hypothetical protein
MSIYSSGRGRRKAVEKLRFRDGFWILVVITVFLIALLYLMVHGYINVDRD